MKKKIAAIDIGTTKVCTIMGVLGSSSGLRVQGVGIAPSHSIEKDLVADAAKAKESIRVSIKKAEVMAGHWRDRPSRHFDKQQGYQWQSRVVYWTWKEPAEPP